MRKNGGDYWIRERGELLAELEAYVAATDLGAGIRLAVSLRKIVRAIYSPPRHGSAVLDWKNQRVANNVKITSLEPTEEGSPDTE